MKLAKRVSIALLAACVVGGSALTMTACGGEPTSDPTQNVPADTDPEVIVSHPSYEPDFDGDAGDLEAVEFRRAFQDSTAFLEGFPDIPLDTDSFRTLTYQLYPHTEPLNPGRDVFVGRSWDAMETNMIATAFPEEEWKMPSYDVLEPNEKDVSIYGALTWTSGNYSYSRHLVVYFGYDEGSHQLRAYKMVLGELRLGGGSDPVLDFLEIRYGEDAHNRLSELLREVRTES